MKLTLTLFTIPLPALLQAAEAPAKPNIIVILWGGHGWHLGEHNFWGKHNTMHLSTRVPLILKVPGKQPGNTRSLVETSDIFPTLCAIAGMDLPKSVQGRDFSKLLSDPHTPFRDAIYNRYGGGNAIITENFTYISYGKTFMLYDLKNDPEENTNIAGKPEHTETVGKMKALLKQRQQEAGQYKTES